MRSRMKLGDFLVAYLRRAGVSHIFGLPGDLVLGLFHRFGRSRELEIVTFSHEPAVGFAADGYARSTRRTGRRLRDLRGRWPQRGEPGGRCLRRAGAAARRVSGGPGEAEQKIAGVHHQAKDVEGQCRIFAEVTCDARILRHPALAAEEVHEVMHAIAREHRPGYLEIHRDMVDVTIPVPKEVLDWDGSFPRPSSDRRKLDEAVSRHPGAARGREASGADRRRRGPPRGGREGVPEAGGEARHRRGRRPSSRRASSRWTTRSTWASTSARSAPRPSRRGCARPTSCSRWEPSSPT